MRYTRNSSKFKTFSETREKFWKRLRLRGYLVGFLLPLFREVKYSNRTKWLSRKRKSRNGRMVVFKSTFNCRHAESSGLSRDIYQTLACEQALGLGFTRARELARRLTRLRLYRQLEIYYYFSTCFWGPHD